LKQIDNLIKELRHDLKKKLGGNSIVAFLSRMIADDYTLRPSVDDIDHFLKTTRVWKVYSRSGSETMKYIFRIFYSP